MAAAKRPTKRPRPKSPAPIAESAAPFPFVGAGDASYFEWAEVHVWFTRAPKPAERKKIAAGVPKPLADTVDWDGSHLVVASAQGVGRYIEASYATKPTKPTSLTTTSRFKMAAPARVGRFNLDIERWLLEAHAVVPIAVAFRARDWEAGGTAFSGWHTESLPLVPKLLKAIGKPKAKSGLAYLVAGIKDEYERANAKAKN